MLPFTIPNYRIDDSKLPDIAKNYSPINWVKFYKVVLKEGQLSELHEFDNLSKLVAHEHDSPVVYHFVDIQFENTLPLYLFIEVDKARKRITYFRDYTDLQNKWVMFFNSKDYIIFKDPLFKVKETYTYLDDNFPYKDVEFFVGISSLVEVIKHTNLTRFEHILPILKQKSNSLQEIKYFNHTM